MIIFTEVLQHGTLPWAAEHDRRSILWRYSPGNMSFHPSGYSVKEHSFQRHWSEHLHRWPAEWYEGLDEAGQSVLEPACKRQATAESRTLCIACRVSFVISALRFTNRPLRDGRL